MEEGIISAERFKEAVYLIRKLRGNSKLETVRIYPDDIIDAIFFSEQIQCLQFLLNCKNITIGVKI